MNPDPLKDLEDSHAWLSFGRQAALLYRGAIDEGLERMDALYVVSAFIRGMFQAQSNETGEADG